MKSTIENRLSHMLGFTSEELKAVLTIIGEHLAIETAIDMVGSLDPTLVAAVGVEVPEIGIDIAMCMRIWQYFKKENINEGNKLSFIDAMQNHPFESAASGILTYTITSILKFAVGKVAGKVALYVGATVISGGINAVQTITTGLIWAKYSKETIAKEIISSVNSPNTSELKDAIVEDGKYAPAAM